MENKFIKFGTFAVLLLAFNFTKGQGNPGFLGKKIAVGYSAQYCLLKSDEIFYADKNLAQILMNHDVYVEYALKKYVSLAAHMSYQKVPIEEYGSYYGNEIAANYTYQGKDFQALYYKDGGISDFATSSVGLKISAFSRNTTISSPIGVSSFFRADIYQTRALNNNFKYYLSNEDELSVGQENIADPNIKGNKFDRTPDKTAHRSLSIGFGLESKILLTSSVFLRFNGDFNISTSLLGGGSDYSYDIVYDTVDEDLKNDARRVTSFRNMFLLGMGVGVLL